MDAHNGGMEVEAHNGGVEVHNGGVEAHNGGVEAHYGGMEAQNGAMGQDSRPVVTDLHHFDEGTGSCPDPH